MSRFAISINLSTCTLRVGLIQAFEGFGGFVKSDNDRAQAYCISLNEIRARMDAVRAVCRGGVTFGTAQFDYEVVAINFRKALELIAFGSLTANRAAYEAAHKDIQKIWRAKELLERLEKIHRDFFPKPLKQPSITYEQGQRRLHFDDLVAGFLTRAEFVTLYDACSQVIHSQNPFSTTSSISFGHTPLEWAEKITNLLAFHLFRLSGYPQVWVGELQRPDGRAHVSIASPQVSTSPSN